MRSPLRLTAAAGLVASLAPLPVLHAQAPGVQPLDTVRVSSRAAPAIVPAQRSVEVIAREAIARQAARSVTDVLEMALGVDVQRRSPAQADLAIRGSALGQVLVLVDGVRMNDLQTAHFDLDLAVPLAMVDRIEILRGPGATLYGPDAVGGVVNIVTRRAERWHHARVHGGSFGTLGAAIGGGIAPGASGTSVRLAAEAERSTGHRDGADYEVLHVTGGAERRIGTGELAVDFGFGARDFGAADFYAAAPSYERTRTMTAALRYGADIGGGWRGSAVASTRRHTDDFVLRRADPAFYRNRHLTWQHVVEVDGRRAFGDRGRLAIGGEAFEAQLESARLGDRRERRAGGFVEGTLGSPAGPNLSAGVRVDRSTSLGTVASPTLSASVPVGARARLRGSMTGGVRAPSWTERYYEDPSSVANPEIGPERFRAAEVGGRLLPAWGVVDVALFVREADDLIDWVRAVDAPPTDRWTTANLERATFRGFEVVLTPPSVAGFDVSLNATGIAFTSAAAETVVGKYALRPLTRIVGARVSRSIADRLQVTVDAREAKRATEEAYVLAGVRSVLRVGGLSVHLDVTNVFGADYLDASAVPAAGRGIFLGVSSR